MSDEESLSSDEILNLPESELREWIRKKRVELGIKPEPPTENAPESPSGGNISPLALPPFALRAARLRLAKAVVQVLGIFASQTVCAACGQQS